MERGAGSDRCRDSPSQLDLELSASQRGAYFWRGASSRIGCAIGSPASRSLGFGATGTALGSLNTHRRYWPGCDDILWDAFVHHSRHGVRRFQSIYFQNDSRPLGNVECFDAAHADPSGSFADRIKPMEDVDWFTSGRGNIACRVAVGTDIGTPHRLFLEAF